MQKTKKKQKNTKRTSTPKKREKKTNVSLDKLKNRDLFK